MFKKKPTSGVLRAQHGQPNPLVKSLFVEAATWLQQDELRKGEEALDKHLALSPTSWPGLYMKALIAAQTSRYELAEQLWLKLMKIRPDYTEGYLNLGQMYEGRNRLVEAKSNFETVLKLDPNNAKAHIGLGEVYRKIGKNDDALKAYRNVKEISSQAQLGIAAALKDQGHFESAVEAMKLGVSHDVNCTLSASNLLFYQHFVDSIDAQERFDTAKRMGPRFSRKHVVRNELDRDPERPLRIGVVSGDFLSNPVGYFFETAMGELSKNSTQWIAFSNNSKTDDVTARLRPLFEKWHAIEEMSDGGVAQLVVDEKIDVLIDLAGHIGRNRLLAFAAKPAPIQITWLGYFSTTGLEAMDYVIADGHCVPKDEEKWFKEKVLHMPDSRFCFSPPFDTPEVSTLPVLSGRHFTFGCFQQLGKVNGQVMETWGRILNALPNSKIRFQSTQLGYEEVMKAFTERLRAAGINDSQVELHTVAKRYEYLEAYADVDLVLDTFPYPGGTTTMEALWMGVPTLTLAVPGMLGRQGEGLLVPAGLTEFVCLSKEDYVRKAIEYGSKDSSKISELAELRGNLREKVNASPLMDARLFANNLDQALRDVWRSYCVENKTVKR